jgi:glycerol kinase
LPASAAPTGTLTRAARSWALRAAQTAGHIARAALESIAYQTADVLEAMQSDSGIQLAELRVDGVPRATTPSCSFRRMCSGVRVVRPRIHEHRRWEPRTYAGLGVGVWGSGDQLDAQWAARAGV